MPTQPDGARSLHGRTRSRARWLAPGGEGRRSRPRGPARHLPPYADHARDRGARAHPLQAGQDPRLVLHPMVSHLPAMLPVATGMALAFKIRGDRRVALGWFGEGAAARGDAHESMNMAGVRQLPIVYVCDNNQWAYSTPTYLSYPVEHIADPAPAARFHGGGV